MSEVPRRGDGGLSRWTPGRHRGRRRGAVAGLDRDQLAGTYAGQRAAGSRAGLRRAGCPVQLLAVGQDRAASGAVEEKPIRRRHHRRMPARLAHPRRARAHVTGLEMGFSGGCRGCGHVMARRGRRPPQWQPRLPRQPWPRSRRQRWSSMRSGTARRISDHCRFEVWLAGSREGDGQVHPAGSSDPAAVTPSRCIFSGTGSGGAGRPVVWRAWPAQDTGLLPARGYGTRPSSRSSRGR